MKIYQLIKNEEVINSSFTTKEEAMKIAQKMNADYVVMVIDFEPIYLYEVL